MILALAPPGRSMAAEPPAPGPEQLLLARARRGEADAFRGLFERYAPPVRRLLRDLLKDDATADEATQETFVRAHRRLGSLQQDEKLLPWLFGIARLVCHEQIRERRRLAPDAEPPVEDADPAPGPEAALLGNEADAQLSRALGQLSEERRTALVLRLDHGLPYDEIAETLGWTLAKVKNEIHRARLQLRAHLAPYLGGAA